MNRILIVFLLMIQINHLYGQSIIGSTSVKGGEIFSLFL